MKHLIIALVLTLTASFSMATCTGSKVARDAKTNPPRNENYSNEGRSVPQLKVLASVKTKAQK